MPNTIPPFVCNTPPPIDESEGEEDLCESNDNFDQFNDESLPSSPHLKHLAASETTTILPNEILSVPGEGKKPTDHYASSSLDLETKHTLEDLVINNVTDDDEETHFECDKFRNSNNIIAGEVYSERSNSTIPREPNTNGSKPEEIQAHLEALVSDEKPLEDRKNELMSEDNTLSAKKTDETLSSLTSTNLDSIPQELELSSFSNQNKLNIIENSSRLASDTNENWDEGHTAALSDDSIKPEPFNEDSPSKTEIVALSLSNSNNIDTRTENLFNDSQDEEFCTHFDADFGQFATFEDVSHVEKNLKSPKKETYPSEFEEKCDNTNTVEEYDDDEFGEYSDFQQTSGETENSSQNDLSKNNVLLYDENIKRSLNSILTTLFPNEDNFVSSSDYPDVDIHEGKQFINETTTKLKNVENSCAIADKWAKSTSKTVLVKALGIDSRNILYGEKWNSCAPKFAANLGLSPLEPMKVTTSSLNESDIKTTKSILDVPAAQFDWNSSGLINPLDASHAYLYSALLDLEQLVVVANIDKINLNSSSSACSTTNSTQFYSSKSTTSSFQNVSAFPLNDMKRSNNNHHSTYQHELNSLAENIILIKNSNGLNTVNQLLSDANQKSHLLADISNQMNKSHDLYFRVQKPSYEKIVPLNQNSQDLGMPDTSLNASAISLSSPSSILVVDSTLQPEGSCQSSLEPTPTSDSWYTVPGGTMKETHIFTPSKPISNEMSIHNINSNIDSAQLEVTITEGDQVSTDCVVIKENVVKKEYRDVEYDLSKVASPSDDFTEFQFVQPATIIGPNTNITIANHPKNTLDFLPHSSSNNFDPEITKNERLSADDPNILSNLSDKTNENCHAVKNIPSDFGCATHDTHVSSYCASDQKYSHSKHDVVYSPFQSLENPLETLHHQNNANLKTTINAVQPTNFLDSSRILTPQMVSMQSSLVCKAATTIQWPEPGLNIDQLEQLEKRFSSHPVESKLGSVDQKNNTGTNADDEWTDFVSVVQSQTPITNILNKNLLKQQQQANNDEDDWSEFMSSTPPPVPRIQQNSISNEASVNYESIFKPWNTPIQAGISGYSSYIVQPNSLRQSTCNSTIHETNAYHSTQQPITPSIIFSQHTESIVAPKSLVNMPNRPKAKK